MENPFAFEVATPHVLTIDVDQPASQALLVMRDKKIRHLLVTQHERALGVVSERDLMKALRLEIEDFYSVRVQSTHIDPSLVVRDVMSWPIRFIDEKTVLTEIVKRIIDEKISSLIVTQNQKIVTGIITTEDLLKILQKGLVESGQKEAQSVMGRLALSPLGEVMKMLSNTGI